MSVADIAMSKSGEMHSRLLESGLSSAPGLDCTRRMGQRVVDAEGRGEKVEPTELLAERRAGFLDRNA